MLGLGSNITKAGKIGKPIVKDGLVLKHGYARGPVEPCSTGAAYFNDSANDYISIGNPANLNMGDGSFSVSCWARSIPGDHATDADFVLAKADGEATAAGSDEGYALYLGDGRTDWIFWVSDGTGAGKAQATVATNANQWYHLCGTFDGSRTVKLYVDGVLVNTGTAVNSGASAVDLGNIDVSNDFNIGRATTNTRDFSGYICNVGVWKGVVLTQPQVKSIMHKNYAALSASEKTNLVSWWNLDSTMVTAKDGGKFGALDSHYGGGSELGSEMWDGANGDTTHWVNYGTENEISSDDGAVKITYKDDSGGYYIFLMDGSHLNANLVVGKFYRLTFSTKINNGSVNWTLNETGEDSYDTDALTSTSFITQQIDFLATASQDHFLFPASMDGTEEVWIKDISLKLINGNTGTLA